MSSACKGKIASWLWYEEESVGSTNDEIKKLVPEAGESIVISAVRQTGGRGRRGRVWQGLDGNLFFTYSLSFPISELSRIVCLTGLSLAETVKKIAPSARVQIKWPNDVFLEGKKLSGILLENISDNLWGIGIGVNIVSSPRLEDMPYQAVSLKECGIMLDRTEFLHYYLHEFAADLAYCRKAGFAAVKERWLALAMNYRQNIGIKTETGLKEGVFADMDDNGYLLLQTADGKTERIIAGDLFTAEMKKNKKENKNE